MPKHETFTLARTLTAECETVFAAFADPAARAIWSPPSPDLNMQVFQAEFRPGGRDIWRCGPGPAEGVDVETLYHAIEPNSMIVSTEVLRANDVVEGASLVTVTFEAGAGGAGTELTVTVQATGLGTTDTPAEMHEGWTAALSNLSDYLNGNG